MFVRDVMTSPVVTVAPKARVKKAIRLLDHHDVTALPVVDESGTIVGIVSEMDLLRGEFQADPRAFLQQVGGTTEPPPRRVHEVMTQRVLTVRENTDLADLAELMMTSGVKSVPVVRGDHVVGIVSRRDLVHLLARADGRIREELSATLEEYYPDGPTWDVTVREGVVKLRGQADDRTERLVELLTGTVPGVVRVELVHPG